MKRRIAVLCAVSALAASALPAAYASEPAATSNITITTEFNGQGVVTKYDGDKLVTDTYTTLDSVLNSTKKPDIDTDKSDTTTDKDAPIQPEIDITPAASAAESAVYDSYFFQMIKRFVIQCMDEYNKDSSITATSSPKPTAMPTAAPAHTVEPDSTGEPQATAEPESTDAPQATAAPEQAQ